MRPTHSLVVRSAGLAAFVLLSLAGCGGGSGGGSNSSSAKVDVLVQDAPSEELLSFTATVQEVRLVSGGNSTSNLLDGNVTVEFLGLQTSQAWLSRSKVSPGSYDSVELVFDAASVVALDKTGAPVAVTVTSNVLAADFGSTFVVDSSDYGVVVADLDLTSSLSGSVAAPPLLFAPQGSATGDDGSVSSPIDELKGIVKSSDEGNQTFVVDAFADDDLAVPLGEVRVDVQPTTVLLNDDGAVLSNDAFFGALNDGATVLEVHGVLIDGVVQATRIDIEDQQGGFGNGYQVKIEGLVTAIGPGQQFELLMIEIEKGADIAAPALANLGNPASIIVSYDGLTLFVLSDSSTISDDTALTLGGRVKVKFPTFVAPPFYASQVEIEDGPEFEGSITDISGLPDSIVMHLEASEPAIASGQVASSSTDVIVDLTTSSVSLDTNDEPSLQASQLLVGLKIEVHGSISGPPTGPTIASTKLVVHAGRFKGTVLSVSPGTNSFVADVTDLKDPFGDTVTTSPYDVVIDPGCEFDDEASSAAEFFALFQGLNDGETLEVEVEGIGTGNLDEVQGYGIKAKVN